MEFSSRDAGEDGELSDVGLVEKYEICHVTGHICLWNDIILPNTVDFGKVDIK